MRRPGEDRRRETSKLQLRDGEVMYIGMGTLVVVLLIVLIIYFIRRA
jgi:hypothetical protein